MEALARQEIVSILATFVVGFIAGGFLYLNHFTKLVSPDDVGSIEEVAQLTITSEAYGSCGTDCPAFQVSHDGSYRYRYSPQKGAEPIFVNGTLPLNVQRSVKRAITEGELAKQTQPTNPTNCPSFNDGIDIAYTISYQGKEYAIDSCGTSVDFDSGSWLALSEIWTHLGTVR